MDMGRRIAPYKRFGAAKTLPQGGLNPPEEDENRGPRRASARWGEQAGQSVPHLHFHVLSGRE